LLQRKFCLDCDQLVGGTRGGTVWFNIIRLLLYTCGNSFRVGDFA